MPYSQYTRDDCGLVGPRCTASLLLLLLLPELKGSVHACVCVCKREWSAWRESTGTRHVGAIRVQCTCIYTACGGGVLPAGTNSAQLPLLPVPLEVRATTCLCVPSKSLCVAIGW